jgi:hypothetical protein
MTPPLATAAIMRAICSGVTRSCPCPIDMFTVSPGSQLRFERWRWAGEKGTSPKRSPPRSMPVGDPRPKACAYFAIMSPPTLSPAW